MICFAPMLALLAVVDYRPIAEAQAKAARTKVKPKRLFRYGDWPVAVGK